MVLSIEYMIMLLITSISFIDFIVFTCLYINFILIIPRVTTIISTKIISICIIVFFITFKIMHIPMFLYTMPILNYQFQYFDIILGILTSINICLAAIPLFFAIYTSFILDPPSKEQLTLSANKQVFIIMPIYNEVPEALWNAIESVLTLDYNLSLLHLYLCFDDEKPNDSFMYIIKKFDLDYEDIKTVKTIEIKYKQTGLNISIMRLPHGGKKSAQYGGFKEISKNYSNLEDSLVFFIDSDIILKNDSLSQFTYYMNKYDKYCLTGIITCIASDNPSFLTYYQDIEYISGQVFTRNMETYMGATTCLPGAFTIIKYSCLNKVEELYFTSKEYNSIYDYHRFYLGEDRYLTHLLMEEYPWKIGFCENARCKTDAPKTIITLLKQRRRWSLGHISNDTWMMSSVKIWTIYPLLSLFNILNNARSNSIYIYLLYFILLLNKQIPLVIWLIFIVLPILMNWLFIISYAFKINRKMNILFYFIIIAFQPILSMIYMYYTIYTMKELSWGGIRVDKEKHKNDDTIIDIINKNDN